MKILSIILSLILFSQALSAPVEDESHTRSKRQLVPPMHMGLGSGIAYGALGPMGVAGLGLGGIGIGPIGLAAVLPPNFGRPVPGGPHAGAYGGIVGSPTFGPSLAGPFNHPVERESRLNQLVNHVRRSQNRPVLPDPAAGILDYAYYPYDPYFYPYY